MFFFFFFFFFFKERLSFRTRQETHGRVAPRGALPASGVKGVIRGGDRKGAPEGGGWGG